MVRIRLRRVGSKRQPSYRVVAIHSENPRDGAFLEILGHYNPRTQPSSIHLEEARIYDWMSKGAQPSESAAKIFKSVGLLERYARLKAGESIDVLSAEAVAAEASRVVNPRTSQH